MRLASLRLRQLALAAGSLLIVLLVAGYAFAAIFADHTQRSLEAHLVAELTRLTALVDATTEPPSLVTPLPDARYETPAGGIYWQLRDPAAGTVVRSRSLWDEALTPSATGSTTVTERLTGPAGQTVLATSQTLTFEGMGGKDRPLQLVVAEDVAEVEAANAAFRTDLARALAIIAVALLGTYWLTVEIGLAPLRRIKQDVARIRSGSEQRLTDTYPSEVQPLVQEVNDLIGVQEQSIVFARQRAADLAHGLKTSLTLMNGQAFELQRSGNAEAAARIEQLTNAMTETVDHQLKLSRLRHRARSDRHTADLVTVARKVVAAVKATPRGRELTWHTEVPQGTSIALDEMDLSELLGVILENASDWAKSAVRLEAKSDGGRVTLSIADDGPGLDDEALAGIGERGRRLDETRPGTGIGLSIAREIVSLNGGTLAFARAPQGGLLVTVEMKAGALR